MTIITKLIYIKPANILLRLQPLDSPPPFNPFDESERETSEEYLCRWLFTGLKTSRPRLRQSPE